jgi:hypothetical protein
LALLNSAYTPDLEVDVAFVERAAHREGVT